MYTEFYDMCSGGRKKLGASKIYIEAPEDEAVELFEAIFDRDPYNVTCPCCGNDYAIWEQKGDLVINDGSWIVTKEDVERFKTSGKLIEFDELNKVKT